MDNQLLKWFSIDYIIEIPSKTSAESSKIYKNLGIEFSNYLVELAFEL